MKHPCPEIPDMEADSELVPTTDPNSEIDSTLDSKNERIFPHDTPKVPEYISTSIKKTDLEKSMELLRQRRDIQRRAEQLLDSKQVTAEAIEQEQTLNDERTSGKTFADRPISAEQEESYSPRIIW